VVGYSCIVSGWGLGCLFIYLLVRPTVWPAYECVFPPVFF
jgi:hypothetical protein